VEDTRTTVRALARKHEFAVLAIKGGSPVEKLLDTLRTLFHEYAGGFGIDQTVTSSQRIFEVECYVFIAAHGDCDAALGIGGIRLRELFLCDDEYGA
jgi:hypothetical protein